MIRVFDADGNQRDRLWAMAKYNLPPINEAPRDRDHWEVVELHESIGPSSMTVRVIGDVVSGDVVSGVPISFGWPDEFVIQDTNAEGHTGFGMGGGAYYDPETEEGPHYVFVHTGDESDEVTGLGMIGGTNHAHLEPTFQFVIGEEEPGPSVTTREALVFLLDALGDAIFDARELLERE